jgi:hypothetical protein
MPFSNPPSCAITFRFRWTVITAILAGLLSACAGDPPPGTAKDPETVAKELVAEFLEVAVADTRLVSLDAQEFNDSSLGCPEPGMSYLQALTPGYRVVVEAEGRRFDVRVSSGYGRICRRNKSNDRGGNRAGNRGGKVAGAPAPGASADTSVPILIDLARRDLARHLDADSKNITVLDVRPFDAQAVAKGCSPACSDDSSRCGYMIGLQYDGRRYDYFANEGADGETVTACPPLLTM